MNLAKISNNGQITLPVEIRRDLNVKPGDKLVFLRNKNGEIIVQNLHTTTFSMNGVDPSAVNIAVKE